MTFRIRPAVPADSSAIALLMRTSVSARVRGITVMGSEKLHVFLAQQIETSESDAYVVGTLHERIIAMSAWRHAGESLLLNHLYVLPGFRGQGFGAALIVEYLGHFRRSQEQHLALDVFLENERARTWYRSWGMQVESRTSWNQVRMPNLVSGEGGEGGITGLSEADGAQARFGFSQFSLQTDLRAYTVGRLGDTLFRVGTFSILEDPTALRALSRLDAGRQLLCFGPLHECTAERFRPEMVVAESERLVCSCDRIQACLAARGVLTQRPRSSPVV